MKKSSHKTTIVAPATATGSAAISIVRISGPNALIITQRIWQPLNKKAKLKPRELTLGWLVEERTKLDQALLVYMPGPNSYTGEDVVELHLHGAPIITQKALQLLQSAGAALAEPGEFTRRAFLNNKLDLTQAEAVGELIASGNEQMMRLASRQLAGGLTDGIAHIKSKLLALAAHSAASLDFSEEDIVDADNSAEVKMIEQLTADTSQILEGSASLGVVRDGFTVALVGLPNAGKSTLLNALLGYDRSIVTEVAGTTRDTITEKVVVDDMGLQVTDTAGLRDSKDDVEKIGITRTATEIRNSDIITVLIEPGQVAFTLKYLRQNDLFDSMNSKNTLVVFTKSDLDSSSLRHSQLDRESRKQKEKNNIKQLEQFQSITISATKHKGLDKFRYAIHKLATDLAPQESLSVLTARQINLLKNLRDQLVQIKSLLEQQISADIVLVEYQRAISLCNQLTGEEVTQEIIDHVFSNFCIGK